MLLLKTFSVLFFLLIQVSYTFSGKFFIWIPLSSRSAKIGVMEVGEELGRRGHEVSVVSPHKYKTVPPGVRDIVIQSDFDKVTTELTENFLNNPDVAIPWNQMIDLSVDSARTGFESEEVQNIIKNEEIDVVITFPMFGNEAVYALAHKKNASLVFFMTAPFSFPHINWGIGDTYNPSFMPIPITGFSQSMNFVERFMNTIATGMFILLRNFSALPKTQTMVDEVFPGEDIPSLSELTNTVSLFISHGTPFTGDGLRPVMPNTILAGLMTCRETKPLPDELKDFIEKAENGVIFVSFGSVVKASRMPEEKRRIMLNVFSRLKQKVIWKWETPMEDAPANVMLSSWLPQTSLLAHPNVKMFITHGGAGSVQETICHKTPIVGVPFSGDQPVNVKEAVSRNIGVKVDWHDMTEEILETAIHKVINDPIYQSSITKLSDLIMDQPQHPLDRSIWWLEYLLRHPHNTDMKPVTHGLYWFQYFLLDVIAVLLLIVSIIVLLFVKTVKYFFKVCRKKPKKD